MEKPKILVVEDESIVAKDIERMLKGVGYTVVGIASSGEKAIQKVEDTQPDLVLMDIMLKGDMDGIQTAERIRSRFSIPVIFLTAYADESTLQRAKLTGPFGYIIKPFQERELHTTIEIALYKHKMERKLEENSQWLFTMLRSIGDAVIATDAEGHVMFMNPVAESLTGWSQEQIEGWPLKKVFKIVNEETLEEVEDPVAKVIRDKTIVGLANHTMLIARDGKKLPIDDSAAPITYESGEFLGVVLVFRDITERKRAEETLRRSELQYRTTIDSIGDYIHVVDSDLNIILINKALEELIDRFNLEKDVIGRNLFEVFPFLTDSIRDEYLKVFDTGVNVVTEENTEIADTQIINETRKTPIFENGNVAKVVTVIRDVTEKQRMEEELLKMEKLESIGVLAGGIAHDFNNILTGILGNISLAKIYDDTERISERLVEAEKACIQARNLTQQLLTFSKGGAPIRKTASIAELLRESTVFALRGSNTTCRFSIPDDLWAVEVDEGQINQVINNIVINADQAMPEGGFVKVSAENLDLGSEHGLPLEPMPYIRISIADQGIGIPEEHLKRIFDPYFSTKSKGSGLGLATSYSVIKNHGGHITVKSQLGVGTTFHIYIPASPKDAPLKEHKERRKPSIGKARILVMDDDEMIRQIAYEMLSNLGHEVSVAECGDEAIEIYKHTKESGHPFDAVIIDLTVPGGMGGKETIQGLIGLDPKVKAIVSSGYSNDPIMSDYKKYGFKGVIAKPYETEELDKALCELIANSRD